MALALLQFITGLTMALEKTNLQYLSPENLLGLAAYYKCAPPPPTRAPLPPHCPAGGRARAATPPPRGRAAAGDRRSLCRCASPWPG